MPGPMPARSLSAVDEPRRSASRGLPAR